MDQFNFDEYKQELMSDDDPDDEFEQKFQESYQQHKEQFNRPQSSSQHRPQSASRNRSEEDLQSPKLAQFKFQEGGITANQVYSKLQFFISQNRMQRQDLYSYIKDFAKFEDLQRGMEQLGIYLSDEEVMVIFQDFGIPRSGVIQANNLYNKLFPKERSNFDNPELLKAEAEQILQNSQAKVTQNIKNKAKLSKKRPISGRLRPQSAYAGAGSRKNLQQRTKITELDKELANIDKREQQLMTGQSTQRRNYLKETRQKQANQERELALTVDKCKREFEYDCLHKMGEANEIAQSMNLPTTFRAIRKENGTTKCHIYHNDQFVEEITLENFLREWRKLKRQQRPAINLPQNKKEGQKTQQEGKVQEQPNQNGGVKVNKKERQEELKKLLLETKELTNKLKVQLKILEKKGIISKSMHTSSAAYSSTFF